VKRKMVMTTRTKLIDLGNREIHEVHCEGEPRKMLTRKRLTNLKNGEEEIQQGNNVKEKSIRVQKQKKKKFMKPVQQKFVKQTNPNNSSNQILKNPSNPKHLTNFAKKIILETESNETNELSFATRMMLKMGWNVDKGLGKNSHGMVDFIKVEKKNDKKGIGLKEEKLNHSRKSNPKIETHKNSKSTKKEIKEKMEMKRAKKLFESHLGKGKMVEDDGIETIEYEEWKKETVLNQKEEIEVQC
jgi:hypothetical protein